MEVGTAFTDDGTAEATRIGCNLVQVPAVTSSWQGANAFESYAPVPTPIDQTDVGGYVREHGSLPSATARVCVLSLADEPASKTASEGAQLAAGQYAHFGFPGCDRSLGYLAATTAPSQLRQVIASFKSAKATGVLFTGAPEGLLEAAIADAQAVHFHPVWFLSAPGVTEQLAIWSHAHFDPATRIVAAVETQPFGATSNPSVAEYDHLVGSSQSALGEQAAAAFALFAQTASSCGSSLTRQCLVNQLAAVHTAPGGLTTSADPGSNLAGTCAFLVSLVKGTWVQTSPAAPGHASCSASYRHFTAVLMAWLHTNFGTVLTHRHLGTGAGDVVPR